MQVLLNFFLLILLFIHLSKADNDSCTIKRYDQVQTVLKKCQNVTIGDLIIPGGKTLNIQPQDNTTITIKGNVTFEYFPWLGPLIQINATGLSLVGQKGGFFNGNGQDYWDGMGEWGSLKPHFVFVTAFNSKFINLTLVNTPRYFILLSDSDHVVFDNVLLNNIKGGSAQFNTNYTGHNTDGFDVWNSTYVEIKNSKVFNQDDCIALRCGQHIHVSNLFCHGGNGLSLSVGFDNYSIPLNTLKNVTIEDCTVVDAENIIHVKTHVDGGNGSISDITFKNIKFDVPWGTTGVNIQQNYRNLPPDHPANASAKYPRGNIPITNLKLVDITGSMSTNKTPIHGACSDWDWQNVEIVSAKGHNNCNYKPNGYDC